MKKLDLEQYEMKDIPKKICGRNGEKKFIINGFEKFELFVYEVPKDHSCFFHCVLLAHDIRYRKNKFEEPVTNRKQYCQLFRDKVADSLFDEVKDSNGNTTIRYDVLANGNLQSYAQHINFFKVENLHAAIKNYKYCVGEEILEIISVVVNLNIIILDIEKEDLYNGTLGAYFDEEKPSMVILYYPTPVNDEYIGHYNLIGAKKIVNGEEIIVTHFHKNHSFVKFLKSKNK